MLQLSIVLLEVLMSSAAEYCVFLLEKEKKEGKERLKEEGFCDVNCSGITQQKGGELHDFN